MDFKEMTAEEFGNIDDIQINDDDLMNELMEQMGEQPKPKPKQAAPKPQPKTKDQMLDEIIKKADGFLDQASDDLDLDDIDIKDEDFAKMGINMDEFNDLSDSGEEEVKPKPKKAQKPKPKEVKIENVTPNVVNDLNPAQEDEEVEDDEPDPVLMGLEIEDEDDDEVPEAVMPKQRSKVHLIGEKVKAKPIETDSVGEAKTYEQIFNYFATNVFNYLNYCDDPNAREFYMDHIEQLAPIIFDGPDAKITPVRMFRAPKQPPPFSLWKNVSKNDIEVVSALQKAENYDSILNKDIKNLSSYAKELIKVKDQEQAKILARAAKQCQSSIHRGTEPPILTTNVVSWKMKAVNPDIAPDEVNIKIRDVKNIPKGTCKLVFQLPVLKSSVTIEITQTDPVTVKGLNRTQADKKFQTEQGKVTLDMGNSKKSASVMFGLSGLLTDCTLPVSVCIGPTVIDFTIDILAPLSKQKYNFFSYEYHVSPIVLTEGIKIDVGEGKPEYLRRSYINIEDAQKQPKPAPKTSPKAAPKTSPKPAPKTSPKPAPKAPPKTGAKAPPKSNPKAAPQATKKPARPQVNEIPEIRIFTDQEANQFWPIPILEVLKNQAAVIENMYKSQKQPIPPEISKQYQTFNAKYDKLMEDVNSGAMTQDEYIKQLKLAIKRETDLIPHTDPKWKQHTINMINAMKAHLQEVSP